jgi:hypothetical protein
MRYIINFGELHTLLPYRVKAPCVTFLDGGVLEGLKQVGSEILELWKPVHSFY